MTWDAASTISLISALAAIASAIYAGKTYRATVALKEHDMALELRQANGTLRATVSALPGLLKKAGSSHQAVLAAIGQANSGAMQAWRQRVGEIEVEIRALEKRLPSEGKPLSPSLKEMTDLISATHEFQRRASALSDELSEVLNGDDRQRDHIRNDQRTVMAARMSQPTR